MHNNAQQQETKIHKDEMDENLDTSSFNQEHVALPSSSSVINFYDLSQPPSLPSSAFQSMSHMSVPPATYQSVFSSNPPTLSNAPHEICQHTLQGWTESYHTSSLIIRRIQIQVPPNSLHQSHHWRTIHWLPLLLLSLPTPAPTPAPTSHAQIHEDEGP